MPKQQFELKVKLGFDTGEDGPVITEEQVLEWMQQHPSPQAIEAVEIIEIEGPEA